MSEMYLEIDTDDEAEWEQAMKEVCSHQADLVLAVLACTQCRLTRESCALTAPGCGQDPDRFDIMSPTATEEAMHRSISESQVLDEERVSNEEVRSPFDPSATPNPPETWQAWNHRLFAI